jgi:hypothetical protein
MGQLITARTRAGLDVAVLLLISCMNKSSTEMLVLTLLFSFVCWCDPGDRA